MSAPDANPLRLGGVAPGRLRFALKALRRVQDELSPLLDAAFFRDAPFSYVCVVVHAGARRDPEPKLVEVEDGELSFAIELPYEELRKLRTVEELADAFRGPVLEALLRVAEARGLDASALRAANATR